jgi:hypothetical protein
MVRELTRNIHEERHKPYGKNAFQFQTLQVRPVPTDVPEFPAYRQNVGLY